MDIFNNWLFSTTGYFHQNRYFRNSRLQRYPLFGNIHFLKIYSPGKIHFLKIFIIGEYHFFVEYFNPKNHVDTPESALILAHVTLIALKVAMNASIPSASNALILKKIPISKNAKTLSIPNWKYAWPTVLEMRLALLLAPMNTLKN